MFNKISNLKVFGNCKLKIEDLLEYGFYLFVFLLPWQTHLVLREQKLKHGVWEYGTISLFGTDILLIILLTLFFFLSLRGVPRLRDDEAISPLAPEPTPQSRGAGLLRFARNDKMVWIILSFLDLAVFVSMFFAPDKILTLYHYGLFLLGLGLFWLVVKIKYDKVKLAIAFFSGALIQAILAIQQFLTQGAFASKWLGMAAHLPVDLGASVIETVGSDGVAERWLRAYGALPHPNILGAFLTVSLIVLAWMIFTYQRASNKKTDKKFIIYHLSFIIIFVALIFTFSRSAWLALAAAFAIMAINYFWKKNFSSLKKMAGVFALMIVLGGLIFVSYQNLFFTRLEGGTRLENKSLLERKTYQDDSFALIKNHWFFGVGLGNYTKALAEKDSKRPWYSLNPVHNVFLLAWAETGIFGLIFFCALLVCLFWQAARKKSVLSLSILSALVIIMVLDHYLWSLPSGILFFWLAAGFISKEIIN